MDYYSQGAERMRQTLKNRVATLELLCPRGNLQLFQSLVGGMLKEFGQLCCLPLVTVVLI